jgi:hypothetical protein
MVYAPPERRDHGVLGKDLLLDFDVIGTDGRRDDGPAQKQKALPKKPSFQRPFWAKPFNP